MCLRASCLRQWDIFTTDKKGIRGSNLRHSMDVANTRYDAMFDLQGKFFPFVNLYKLVSVKTKQCRRCLIYNDHAQKCRCLYNHLPTNIEAGDF